MPAKSRSASSGGWGVTYADVGKAVEEYEIHHNCTVEFTTYYTKRYKKATTRLWSVVCLARWNRNQPNEILGMAECAVGWGSGAASMPGAYLQSLIRACENLEARRAKPQSAPEVLRLPGFE